MPAHSPEQLHELFARYFSAGDVEGMMSLYEPGATMLPTPGPAVNGVAAIRELVIGFVARKPQMVLQVKKVVRAADIAVIFSSWSLQETDSNGEAIERTGLTTDVVRQQPDGTWLLLIDIPHGAAAAV